MIKRYVVFIYPAYYPAGGWCDFRASFEDKDEALKFAAAIEYDCSGGKEVIDLYTGEDVYVYSEIDNENLK